MGFAPHCDGNLMLQNEPNTMTCQHCKGDGSIAWNSLEDLIDHISARLFRLRKDGNEIKSIFILLKFILDEYKNGEECEYCCGSGKEYL